MKKITLLLRMLAGAACLAWVFPAPLFAADDKLGNATCLECHAAKSKKIEVPGKDGEERALGHVDTAKYGKGTHGDMQCVACHKDITDSQASHVRAKDAKPANCIACHEALWETAKQEKLTEEKARLGLVVRNIEAYKKSFHAKPDKDDPSRPMAICEDCHSSHEFHVPPQGTTRRTVWHKEIPETCGTKCHEDQLESYASSIHGQELLLNVKSAVCTDCHSSHDILQAKAEGTSSDTFKLANVRRCGGCHEDQLKSYFDTYHGQVNRLGYAYTAKCADCHESHRIQPTDHPKSSVNPNKRLKTCQKCHSDKKPGMRDATPGFVSFKPHANTHDFKKYPEMYVTAKFMVGLFIFVFAFFWTHSLFWFYREWQNRRKGIIEHHINIGTLGIDEGKHFRRFHWGWRVGHIALMLAVMTLVLTGTTVMFAHTDWAPVVANALGGPKVLGLVHRIAAATFVGVFLIHLAYVMQKLLRDRNFRWFGPDSLLPNWKDFADAAAMLKWFLGDGPKPLFDRWTYFEKFDYWAVFWGVNIIGWSGLLLAFPHVTAQYLPGWVFNVATLFHGEEAILAAVFLFTVHFFNNHFRPGKLPPPDVVMFTGTQSLEEFRHEHPAQYRRLVESGEITKHLVEAPSRKLHVGSVVLGLVLLGIGLTLLVLVLVGLLSGTA